MPLTFLGYNTHCEQSIVLTLYDYFADIKGEEDLIPPGAKPGTVPTDVEQATGLERLELIGKMQGIDIFDMRPLDASRKGMRTSLHEMSRGTACRAFESRLTKFA
jgi:hypothetical protein